MKRLTLAVTLFVRPDFDVDKKGAYADIEAKGVIARTTVWDSGEYEQEAIETKTGNTKLSEYHICESPNELWALLDRFLKKNWNHFRIPSGAGID